MPREASENFWRAFCGMGLLVAECSCGRTHFAADRPADYEEGELDALLANEKKDPDRFRADHNNDSISAIEMPDGLIVWGCPCCRAARYENFILSYKGQILEFYRLLLAERQAEVDALKSGLRAAGENRL